MKKCSLLLFLFIFGVLNVGAQSSYRLAALQRLTYPLYRKPTKGELKAIAPDPQLFRKYADFLKQPDTGLTKLAADTGCAENTKVIVATEDCLKYTMPGAGYAYSFRVNNYRIPRLADIIFTDNSFQASGVLLHGILVNVGDVPLDKVNLQTKGLKFLVDFPPEPDYEKAKVIDDKLTVGIEHDNFLYRRGLYAKENTTFVLRSIAYSGKYFRAVDRISYNEFAFDRRRDVIIAFRIVDKDEARSVTILWKMLANKKSPRVKREQMKSLN